MRSVIREAFEAPTGVDVSLITAADFAIDGFTSRLMQALAEAGLGRPKVTARAVDRLDRHPVSGKFRRFVPL
jgi:phenylacetate-CoA ligase